MKIHKASKNFFLFFSFFWEEGGGGQWMLLNIRRPWRKDIFLLHESVLNMYPIKISQSGM